MKYYIPKWNTLRVIGKSKTVSLTILVPFIGYLILFNSELVAYFALSNDIMKYPESQRLITEETITRLYYLYFGLTILGITSIGFSYACPGTIKEHQSVYDLINSEVKIMTPARFKSLVDPFENLLLSGSKQYTELEGYMSDYRDAYQNADKSGALHERVLVLSEEYKSSARLNVLAFIWTYYANSKPIQRFLVTTGYALGFLLVLFPSAQVLTRITTLVITGL